MRYFFDINTRLMIDPNVCHDKPVVRGTRVLVSTILGALGAGDSMDDILEDYPNITKVDIEAALEFASQLSDFNNRVIQLRDKTWSAVLSLDNFS